MQRPYKLMRVVMKRLPLASNATLAANDRVTQSIGAVNPKHNWYPMEGCDLHWDGTKKSFVKVCSLKSVNI